MLCVCWGEEIILSRSTSPGAHRHSLHHPLGREFLPRCLVLPLEFNLCHSIGSDNYTLYHYDWYGH